MENVIFEYTHRSKYWSPTTDPNPYTFADVKSTAGVTSTADEETANRPALKTKRMARIMSNMFLLQY